MRRKLMGLFLAFLAGCGAPGAGRSGEDSDPFAAPPAKAIKITYIRFNPHPQTRLNRHEYRILVSEGWKRKFGERIRDPFVRLYQDPFWGPVPDAFMEQLLGEMKKRGFEELRETSLARLDLKALQAVEKSSDVELGKRWRLIHVETDAGSKTVVFSDNDDRMSAAPPQEQLAYKFGKIEYEILKAAIMYTVQVTVESQPGLPK